MILIHILYIFSLLRVQILSFACRVGNSDCLSVASEQFNSWLNNAARPPPDLRSVIYTFGMRVNGNESNWNKVWNLYVAESDAQEKAKLLYSLASTTDPWILKRLVLKILISNNEKKETTCKITVLLL